MTYNKDKTFFLHRGIYDGISISDVKPHTSIPTVDPPVETDGKEVSTTRTHIF